MSRFRLVFVLVAVLGVLFVPGVSGQPPSGSGVNVFAGLPAQAGPFVKSSAVLTRYANAPRGSRVVARVTLYKQRVSGSTRYHKAASKVFNLRPGQRRSSVAIFANCGLSEGVQYGWFVLVRATVVVGRSRVVGQLKHESTPVALPCS